MKSILFILFFVAVITTSVYSEIYVAPDGNDSNPGTMEQPVESIQQAQSMVSAGDTASAHKLLRLYTGVNYTHLPRQFVIALNPVFHALRWPNNIAITQQ